MTRKDTILIAVVINAGLLAVLFTTAIIYDTDKEDDQATFVSVPVESKGALIDSAPMLIAAVTPPAEDEVDSVLKYYASPQAKPIVVETLPDVYVQKQQPSAVVQVEAPREVEAASQIPSKDGMIEVTVKRGDVLEKIARANKSSVAAIKKANQLSGEHLTIGQVLKVPVKPASARSEETRPLIAEAPKPEVRVEAKREVKKEPAVPEPVYYTVESGDNPWKIAKKFGVKYDEILRLNQLDEEKARNMKIGDRIRVK